MRWQIREQLFRGAGLHQFKGGESVLSVVVSDDRTFEIDNTKDFPLYVFATRVKQAQ